MRASNLPTVTVSYESGGRPSARCLLLRRGGDKRNNVSPRELILLSPYRYPAQSPLMLGADEMAAWMNAYSVLWHPAALSASRHRHASTSPTITRSPNPVTCTPLTRDDLVAQIRYAEAFHAARQAEAAGNATQAQKAMLAEGGKAADAYLGSADVPGDPLSAVARHLAKQVATQVVVDVPIPGRSTPRSRSSAHARPSMRSASEM